ncbi:MAG TPA: N-acyl homoserine lactonase family protein [Gammaproteobacteria bacterium]|nr:N-acyl homoserine lactonase family protein [Gammaproteobacteria bacterium]
MISKPWAVLAAAAALWSFGVAAQNRPAPPATPRIYIFDNGSIKGLDPALFNFKREELKEVDFTDISYLIVHPRGTLMFDSGEIADSKFKDGQPVTEGVMSASKPLLPQLAAAGYRPADINYFALSHYHGDHTGNANEFAGATWIVQKAERDFMFGPIPQGTIITVDSFIKLKDAKTKVLNNENYDVFGDGTVVLMSAPGHTPGHQVLAVKLAHRGLVVLAGDLYHYPEERTTGRTPSFEFNAEQSKASRAKIEQFVKDNHGELWIEHDIATHAALPRSPKYVD